MGEAVTDEHEGWLDDLFRRHHQSLVGFVGRATRAAGSAADVAQEAYLRLAGSDGAALAIEHPTTYLFATARHAAAHAAARARPQWRHRASLAPVPDVQAPDPRPDPWIPTRGRTGRNGK